MTSAERLTRLLRALLPFSPAGVVLLANEELIENPRLSPAEVRGFQDLVRLGESMLAAGRSPRFACAFPLLLEPNSVLPDQLHGLVLEVRASLGLPGDAIGGQPLPQALRYEDELTRLAVRLIGEGGIRLHIAPHPEEHPDIRLGLRGASLGGALYVAALAALEGLVVPPDVVVSAALVEGPQGLVLAPVECCEAKRQVLERERPGCRFICVPRDAEHVRSDGTVRVETLGRVPAEELFRGVFERRPGSSGDARWDRIQRALKAARREYFAQRYSVAEELLRGIQAELDARPDDSWHDDAPVIRFELESRLAAIDLHRGRWEQAEPVLARLRAAPPGRERLSRLMWVEMVTDAVTARINASDPPGARSILERELAGLSVLAEMGSLMSPMDAYALMSWYGVWRRVHLLEGEPGQAVDVQLDLLGVAPEREHARALTDLGECLHRAGDQGGALAVWQQAEQALGLVSTYYGVHTRAFLEFFRARADLMAGTRLRTPGEWARRAQAVLSDLHPESAAAWRLRRVAALARWVDGEWSALEQLTAGAREQESPFVRWCCSLDVLRAGRLVPGRDSEAFHQAASLFREQAVADFGELELARRRFCESSERGAFDHDAIDRLLRCRVC